MSHRFSSGVLLPALLALWGCATGPLPGDLREYGYARGVKFEDVKAAHADLEQRLAAMTTELSAGFAPDKARRIAVLAFESTTDLQPNALGAYLAEKVTHLLYTGRRGTVVERTFLNKVVDELERGYSGRFDELSMQEVGHLLNADTLILGSYTKLTGGLVEVMVRAVAIETGEVVGSASTTVSSSLLPNAPLYPRPTPPLQAKAESRSPALPPPPQQSAWQPTEGQGGGTLNIVPSPNYSAGADPSAAAPVVASAAPSSPPGYPAPQSSAPVYGYPSAFYPLWVGPRLSRPWIHSGTTFRGSGGRRR